MSYKIYGPTGFKKYFYNNTKNQSIKSGLEIDVISDGIIAVEQKSSAYGVFDNELKFIKSSCQLRNKDSQFIPKFDNTDIPFINETVLYFGNVYPQFGHFMLEHMNRAWGLLDDRYKNTKVVLVNNKNVSVPEYMYKLIELLGVKRDDIIILNQTTKFRQVIVPAQGFNVPVFSSYEFISTYNKISKDIASKNIVHEKIYVSRTALGSKKTIGEEKIQKIFEKNGFFVVCPETLPLSEQVSLMKNCKVLAGCAGTALHLALFMPNGGQVIQIKRNRRNKCNALIQYLINKTKNIDSVFICASIELDKTDHGTSAPQIISVNKYLCQFFKDFDFKYDESDISVDTQAWQEYKTLMDEYSKQKGSVFLNEFKHKIIKIVSCFVPGRQRRGRFRKWLKKLLKQN
ncbi:MAG: glycosyltransferase family 61 protein [Rickettsiales bacterium]|jgi:capsular polysaccharide biosynthesis protein|nr:glycosyltransferase family 61 protein [Rickettsiales bacterium]